VLALIEQKKFGFSTFPVVDEKGKLVGLLPGHVVCSSLAAMLYDLPQVGYAHPDLGQERKCEPADWWNWSDEQLWTKPGA